MRGWLATLQNSVLPFDRVGFSSERNVGRATRLVCLVAGGLFILRTLLCELIWPDYHTFPLIETAFSGIGRLIGGVRDRGVQRATPPLGARV